jgi:hypothetical protein
MANYSFEKGKYGGPCGAIFPFFREISGISPNDQDYVNYIPAGFLKCRGQILQANQYPNLARVLGVGVNCIYRKQSITLQEPDQDGSGGTFQLPDLGSKYISSASNSGEYSDDFVTNPSTNLPVARAGVAITLETPSDNLEFTYTGNFRHPGVSSLSFSGQWRIASPPSKTPDADIFISDFLAHGHTADTTISHRINIRNDALASVRYNGSGSGAFGGFFGSGCCGSGRDLRPCESNGDAGVAFVFNTLADEGDVSTHFHIIPPPIVRQQINGSIPSTSSNQMSASSLITTVKINKSNIFKMDDVAPKFIICEYLIKF